MKQRFDDSSATAPCCVAISASWIFSRWIARLTLVLILLAGACLRLLYLWDLQEHPDFQVPLTFQVDMGFIDNSAFDHAQSWRAALGLSPIERRFERHVVWRRNPGDPQLRPPAYTFFLGALYFLFGDHQIALRLAQMALGLCSVWLGYCLGKRLRGRGTGLVVAALLAGYWPLIVYESVIHEPVMIVFCSLLFMNAALWWQRRPGGGRAALMGAACGLYTTAAAAIILFLPVLLMWLGWALFWRVPRTAWFRSVLTQSTAALIAFFAPLAPVAVMNYVDSGMFVLNSYGQGITLYIGNQPESRGYLLGADALLDAYHGGRHRDLRVDEKVALIDSWPRWAAMARAAAAEHIGNHPLWFLRLCLKRALLFWTPHEIPQNVIEYCDKRFSRTLYWFPGGFGLLLPFILMGWWRVARLYWTRLSRYYSSGTVEAGSEVNLDGCLLVGLLVLVWYAPYLVLWISAHFRVPLLPALFVFFALGLHWCMRPLLLRHWGVAARNLTAAGLAMGALWMVPMSYDEHIQTWLYYRVEHYRAQGRLDKAAAAAERVVQRSPHHAFARRAYAQALLELERRGEALAQFEAALALEGEEATVVEVLEQVGTLRRALGDSAGAKEAFEALLARRPDHYMALHGLGDIAFGQGDYAKALPYLERACAADPQRSNAYFLLGMSYAALGEASKAEEAFRGGMAADPADVWPMMGLADLLRTQGKADEACALYRRASELELGGAAARRAHEEHCSGASTESAGGE